jgi:hypothetical protein
VNHLLPSQKNSETVIFLIIFGFYLKAYFLAILNHIFVFKLPALLRRFLGFSGGLSALQIHQNIHQPPFFEMDTLDEIFYVMKVVGKILLVVFS